MHNHAEHAHNHDLHRTNRLRLGVALAVTASIMVAEIIGTYLSGSLTLMVDAAHMFTDSLGLTVAFVVSILLGLAPSARRTWGWQRAEVLAAAVQALILLTMGGVAVVEGIQRLFAPAQIEHKTLLVVGTLGLVANVVSLLVLAGGRDKNLNMRAAFLEVAADALGSVAVLASAGVIALTGWTRADTVASLLVAAVIVPRAFFLLKRSVRILLEFTPDGLDLGQVRSHLLGLPHVLDVHDLHASVIGSGLPILSVHVVTRDECFADGHCLELLEQVTECIESHHEVSIAHCTVQLESKKLAARHIEQVHA